MNNKKQKLEKGKRLKSLIAKKKTIIEEGSLVDMSIVKDNYFEICRKKEEWENDNSHRAKMREEFEKVPGDTFAEKLKNIAEKAREVAEAEAEKKK